MNFQFEHLASIVSIIALLGFIIVILVFCGLGIFLFLIISRKKDQHQLERPVKIAQLASRMGFIYIERPKVPDFLKNTVFATESLMMDGGMNHLIQGTINGMNVLIFDFGIINTVNNVSNAFRHTVICIPGQINQPFIFYHENKLIEPENMQFFLDEAFRNLNYSLQK